MSLKLCQAHCFNHHAKYFCASNIAQCSRFSTTPTGTTISPFLHQNLIRILSHKICTAQSCTRAAPQVSRTYSRRKHGDADRRGGRNTQGLPLDGIRVLDLSRVLAGPYATMLLADQGATVTKVERPGVGDETRQWGPPFVGGESTYFLGVNRNKQSIAVDMKHPEGLEIVRKLIRQSDVLIENYLPGTLDRIGIGWEEAKLLNPRLIYASITGYGQTGPYAMRGGYDVVASAIGGLMHITGPRGGEPCKVGVAMTDLTSGMYCHSAILAGLLARERTGVGMRVDCSLLASQVASLVNVASAFLNAQHDARPLGTAHDSIVPYQAFPTRDSHVVVAAMNDVQFGKLCRCLELESLAANEQFATNPQRVVHRVELIRILSECFRTRTTSEWCDVLATSGLAFGPINNIAQVFADPQVQHENMVMEFEHPTAGPVRVPGMAVKYSVDTAHGARSPNDADVTPPPLLGQHTQTVLHEQLGLSLARVQELINSDVVFQARDM
eukprot:m.334964 g.334964  ORF g.334964 m.334964 type:complete len:498 (-) comp20518_c0_seq3:350-1843(-)